MPSWIITLLGKWPDFVNSLFGALIGAVLGFLTSAIIAYRQGKKESRIKREIHLTNLLYEFDHNLDVLRRIKSFIVDGPNIDHLWAPAEVNAQYLVSNAWHELVISGILSSLCRSDISFMQIANRTVIDAKRSIEELAANWQRVNEWHEYDKSKGNQQLTQRPLLKDMALREIIGRVDYSIEYLEKAVSYLKSIVTYSEGNDAEK